MQSKRGNREQRLTQLVYAGFCIFYFGWVSSFFFKTTIVFGSDAFAMLNLFWNMME